MTAASYPLNELARLVALKKYNVLDSAPERAFDDLTALAAEISDTPIALISLVDGDRIWFKSRIGLNASELPRDSSFCGHAIHEPEILVIPDALQDDRFFDNPQVSGEPHIRFYAGAPLLSSDGFALGALCVIDTVPRELTISQREALGILSRQIVAQLELRLRVRENEEKEARLNLAMEAAQMGIFDWDIPAEKIKWSPWHEKLWAYGPGEFDESYDGFARRLHPDDLLKCEAEFKRCRDRKISFESEFRVIWPDDSVHWISSRGEFSYDDKGDAVRMRGVVVEISDRKAAEAEIKLRQSALEHSLNGFDIMDEAGNLIYANKAFREMWGYESLDEIVGRQAAKHCADADTLPRIISNLKEHGECALEFTALRKDGSTFDALTVTRLLHDSEGRELYAGSTLDITEQKRAELAIRKSSEQLESIINTVDGIVFEVDAKTFRFTFISPRAERLLGYPCSRWIDEATFWADHIHPDDRDEAIRFCMQCNEQGLDHEFEYRMIAADGRSVWLRDIVTVVVDKDGPVTLRGVMVDISAQKEAEGRIKRLNRTHALRSEISQIILREEDAAAILDSACRSAVNIGGFKFAWIGFKDGSSGRLEMLAHAGADEETVALVQSMLGDEMTKPACDFTVQTIEGRGPGICFDIRNDERSVLWRDVALERDYLSMASLPLTGENSAIGTLNLYSSEVGFFDDEEMSLLGDLANNISFAIEYRKRETERQEISLALRDSEAKLTDALKIARLGYWEFRVEDGVFRFNDQIYDLFRTTAEKEGGYELAFWDFINRFYYADDVALAESELQKGLEAPDDSYSSQFEHRLIFGDGSIGHFSVDLSIVKDGQGKTVMAYGISQDITERKLAEEMVHRVQRRSRALIDHSVNVISLIDADRNILYASPSVEKIEGFTAEEVAGRGIFENTHPEDTPAIEDAFAQLKTHPGKPIDLTWRRRHQDGRWLWVEGVMTNLLDDPAVGAIVANYRDITDRRQLEDEYRQSQKLEAIGQLAGGVAHDFNNILTIIHGYGSLMMMDDTISPDNVEAVNQIVQASERASNLTRQLLAFSRRQVMQPRILDLNESVMSIAKMLQRVLGADVSLQLDLFPTELSTRADAGMLDQVLLNLVVNARDAMPDGGHLSIQTGEKMISEAESATIPDLNPGPHVFVRVADTGSGISSTDLRRIFEPFFTTKEQGKGTGLGLATVFGIVKQHTGSVTVESEVGKGTAFQILLPAVEKTEETTAALKEKSAPRGGEEVILLVEDEDPVRNLVRIILERAGYRVMEAPNGIEAMKVWEENDESVQLLLTDIVMPKGISGLELASSVVERNPDLRVVFMSGYSADIAGRELALKEGQNFIQKPVSRDELLETVRRSLDG